MWGWLHQDRTWGMSLSVSGSAEYVKRIKQPAASLTVKIITCLCIIHRSFTDLRRGHSLFSLATPSVDNDFQIYKDDAHDQMNLHVRNQYVYFAGQNYKLNTWHSLCSTWDSASGLAQLWLDGKPSSWKLSSKSSINGPIIIVLGQV